MSQRWLDVADIVRSWTASNWNSKIVTISAVVTATGAALVLYLWKRARRVDASTRERLSVRYDRRMTKWKRRLFDELISLKDARGDGRLEILEIGCGNGTNFQYYPDGSEVICIDRDSSVEAALYESVRQHAGVKISAFHVVSAENMQEVQSGSVDVVVSTIVLCSVGDPDQCLREIIRVLKSGGKFFFLEHVKAPPRYYIYYIVRILQVLFDFAWTIRFKGCHLNRRTQDHIRKAGFSNVNVEEFEANELMQPTKLMTGARLVRSHISGTAAK